MSTDNENNQSSCEGCAMSSGGNVRGFDIIPNTVDLKKAFSEIFTNEFMSTNTNFSSFEGFKFSSAVICNWDKDPLIYSKILLDNFVKESTSFDSWDSMTKAACEKAYGEK